MTVVYRYPTGDLGGSCTKVGAASAWDCLNDPYGSPDDDATHIYTAGSANIVLECSSGFGLAVGTVVNRVGLLVRGYTDSGGGSLRGRMYRVYGDNVSTDLISSVGSYAEVATEWLLNPWTGVAWTVGDVNGTSGNNALSFNQGYWAYIPFAGAGRATQLVQYVVHSEEAAPSGPVIPVLMNLYRRRRN